MSDSNHDPLWKSRVQRSVLAWFRQHARDLPWRRTRDPYAIWISEIMLQQTQVVSVIDYYARFLARFPHVTALASAHEDEVLRLWEGLGYYRRARQMHAAAQQMVAMHDGQFPTEIDAVLALPGIGRYTAGAILSIALDQRYPILEANSRRLLCRLLAYRDNPDKAAGQRLLWRMAEELLPQRHVGRFNQGLMELGSLVCKPRQPLCADCPLVKLCPTYAHGWQEEIPAATRRMRYETRHEVAIVIRLHNQVLLRRCGENQRWAGLWDFPRFEVRAAKDGETLRREIQQHVRERVGIQIQLGDPLAILKHGVTRFRITLHCYQAHYLHDDQGGIPADHQWLPTENLSELPLNTTGRQICRLMANA